jgi:hypothetical protein
MLALDATSIWSVTLGWCITKFALGTVHEEDFESIGMGKNGPLRSMSMGRDVHGFSWGCQLPLNCLAFKGNFPKAHLSFCKPGDIIGVLVDFEALTISFRVNDGPVVPLFKDIKIPEGGSLCPALSTTTENAIELRMLPNDMRYCPLGYAPLPQFAGCRTLSLDHEHKGMTMAMVACQRGDLLMVRVHVVRLLSN